ncbi:hypothetical protein GOODEAATRI_028912 [Goodea atripinnis]|uniref:Secreted protein n=1 Tax=Goodea atripinnis TaxID=208336 RepID=A0ABV0N5B9_9TELE
MSTFHLCCMQLLFSIVFYVCVCKCNNVSVFHIEACGHSSNVNFVRLKAFLQGGTTSLPLLSVLIIKTNTNMHTYTHLLLYTHANLSVIWIERKTFRLSFLQNHERVQ